MPRLTVIIPALGSVESLERTLLSVLENRPPEAEVLVVLAAPYDDPYHLADEVRFLNAPRGADLLACVNLGCRESSAPLVHVLGCGLEVCEGWAQLAVRHFHNPRVAAVTPLVLDAHDHRQVLCAGLEYLAGGTIRHAARGRAVDELAADMPSATGPWIQAAFYRKSALVDVCGGFDSALGETAAEIDLALRLRHAGLWIVGEPACRLYLPPRARRTPRGWRNGRAAEQIFWRNLPPSGGTAPLVQHAWMVAGETVGGLLRPSGWLQLAGRLSAMLAWGSYRRHWAELNALRARGRALVPAPQKSSTQTRVDRAHPAGHQPAPPTAPPSHTRREP